MFAEPPEINVIRNEDGTANWKLNFEYYYSAYNFAKFYFSSRFKLDKILIGYLVKQRLAARKAKDFSKSDEIRDLLGSVSVTLIDYDNKTEWHIRGTQCCGSESNEEVG